MKKPQYTDPYKVSGCDSGNKSGGSICNASMFGESDTWTTFADSNRLIDPTVVGNADVDYTAGTPFNDLPGTSDAPTAITSKCTTVAPANKKLLGFGRSGSEIDVLGTYWGNR